MLNIPCCKCYVPRAVKIWLRKRGILWILFVHELVFCDGGGGSVLLCCGIHRIFGGCRDFRDHLDQELSVYDP